MKKKCKPLPKQGKTYTERELAEKGFRRTASNWGNPNYPYFANHTCQLLTSRRDTNLNGTPYKEPHYLVVRLYDLRNTSNLPCSD